jgi:MCM N-terminal domain
LFHSSFLYFFYYFSSSFAPSSRHVIFLVSSSLPSKLILSRSLLCSLCFSRFSSTSPLLYLFFYHYSFTLTLTPTHNFNSQCAANQESLQVNYAHLGSMEGLLSVWVADAPTEILQIFDEVAMQLVLEMFPNYKKIS